MIVFKNANFLISQPNPMMLHSLESSRRDDFNEGHVIWFGWEIRKLWKLFCSLFLNCSPGCKSWCKPPLPGYVRTDAVRNYLCTNRYRKLLFISYKFVKDLLAITFLLLVCPNWNFHDVCQRFLNQKQNFNWIRPKMRNFSIDPHYNNHPLL